MLKAVMLDHDAIWKQRFRLPIVLWSQVAKAQPTRGLVVSNQSGKYQLYAWDLPTNHLRQLSDHPTGFRFGGIAPDGQHIYYLNDHQGNEIGHYVRIPFEGGEIEDISPDLPLYSTFAFSTSHIGNSLGYVAVTADGYHIYIHTVDVHGAVSKPRLLYHHQRVVSGPTFSWDGEIVVLATTEHGIMQHYNLAAYDTANGVRLAELWDGPEASLRALFFSPMPGDLRLLATTNKTGVERPLFWNLRTGERLDLALNGLQGEVVPVDWSPDGKHILLCQFDQAVQKLYRYELASATLTALNHPNGKFDFFAGQGTFFASEHEIFALWQDATHPMQVIALDSHNGVKRRTVLSAGEAPPSQPHRSIHFPSSDGRIIQGWLGLPDGTGPFPCILHTHGGPEAVKAEVFSPASQSWIEHGFAFLSINYRGSTTFGREFQEKIWGNLGNWEIEDMVAARDWLVKEGIAHPDQIFLMGWSYGGYLTLLGLGKRPDLWAGGMAGIAIADWRVAYEDSAGTLRRWFAALFGGTPQDKPQQYVDSSPITYAENVRAPILIIQGRHDTRTPARSIALYEEKLKALDKSVEVFWFEAGHLRSGIEQDIEHHELMLRFAYRILGQNNLIG